MREMMKTAKHVRYRSNRQYVSDEDKTVRIRSLEHEGDGKYVFGHTNEETMSFIENRYLILRDFIPQDIIDMTMDTWKTIEGQEDSVLKREGDIIFESPTTSLGKSVAAYSFPPAVALHRWLWENLKPVLDFDLKETYAYSRKYERGAYLKSHMDRPSCEISATLCLDYSSDDGTPWSIWIQNDKNYLGEEMGHEEMFELTQAPRHKDRTGTKVILHPGDVMLYQGPNCPHWRDYFVGEYSYHMFLHFIRHPGPIDEIPNSTEVIAPGQYCASHNNLQWDGREDRYGGEGDNKDNLAFERANKAWHNASPEERVLWSNRYDYVRAEEKERKRKK